MTVGIEIGEILNILEKINKMPKINYHSSEREAKPLDKGSTSSFMWPDFPFLL